MDRIRLKNSARESIDIAGSKVYAVSFAFVIIAAVVYAVIYRLGFIIDEWEQRALDYMKFSGYAPQMSGREWGALMFTWVLNIMMEVVKVGFISYCLGLSRHRSVFVTNLGDGFYLFWKIFLIMLLKYIFIALWTCLFVIPGIIAAYRYRMAYFILLDDPSKGALECIRESKRLMQGYKFELFVLDLSFVGWYLLIIMTFGIIAIWRIAYIETTYAAFYNVIIGVCGQNHFEYGPGNNE